MKKNKKMIAFGTTSVLVTIIFVYVFRSVYVGQVSDGLEQSLKINAVDFYTIYASDEVSANEEYLGKLVEVTGAVNDVEQLNNGKVLLTLKTASSDAYIHCTLKQEDSMVIPTFDKGIKVTVKGICIGMLLDVLMEDCVIVFPENETETLSLNYQLI